MASELDLVARAVTASGPRSNEDASGVFAAHVIRHQTAATVEAPRSGRAVDVLRVFEARRTDADDGSPYVVVHSRVATGASDAGEAAMEVFRFDDGLIVETWRASEAVGNRRSPGGHTPVDGASEVRDLDRTGDNARVATDLVDAVHMQGDIEAVRRFVSDDFTQHNVLGADGTDGYVAFAQHLREIGHLANPGRRHQTFAGGNFVLVLRENHIDDGINRFFDLFRLDGGLVVEHWDVIEPIPDSGDLPDAAAFF